MNSRISRSTPYLPRYQSLSPARSRSRRFPSPSGTSQPSERIVYINNAPSRVINSYHVHHSPSPSRTYTIHLCSNKTKNQLTRVTRSLSACDINSSHVYTSHEEIFDRSLKESALRQVGSSEDIYHAVPFFPDVTPSESGVSFGDWDEGSTFGGEDDSVSQHSFGSSSAFCEITVDSELDKCDSDNFSGPDYTGDRALGILHEQFSDTNYALKKRRSRRSGEGPENRDNKITGHVSETTPRKKELVSSQSLDFNKFRTHAEALSVLIPESEVSGKINGKLGKAGNRGSVSTPLAHSTPHVSPGGPGESKLSVMTSWDADAIEEANNGTDPKSVKPAGTLSGQGNETSISSRFEDSSCNSSCSEDNYSDVSNVTTSSPVTRKIKLVKKPSDKPISSKKSFEPHASQKSNTAQARFIGDQKQTNSASEEVEQKRQDRPLYIVNATEIHQDQQQLSADTSEQGEQTDKHTPGDEWWASYGISTTAGEKSKVISGEEDTEKSLAFRRDLKATKTLAGSMPLITPGKHGQEKLRKLSQMSPPRVSSPTGSPPVSPDDIPSFGKSQDNLAEHLISHQIEETRHVSEFVESENIKNHQRSDTERQANDQQLMSVNLHQNLSKTSSDATDNRSSILSEVEIPTNGEIFELELFSGALSHAEEYTHDSQHKVVTDSQQIVVHEAEHKVVPDSQQVVVHEAQHKVVPDSQQVVVHEAQHKVVPDSQQVLVHEAQHKVVPDSQQVVVHEAQHKVVSDSQQVVVHEAQHKVVSDSQQVVVHEAQHKVVPDSQQIVVHEAQQIVVGDSHQTVQVDSKQTLLDDSQHKVGLDSQQKVLQESQQKLVDDSQQTLLEDYQQNLVEDSKKKVVDYSQQKTVDNIQQKVLDDSQQKVAHASQQIVLDDSQQTVVHESHQIVLDDSRQTVVHESQQKVLDDSLQTVMYESQQEVLDDSQQKVEHESQPKVVADSQQKVEHESQQIVLDDSQLTVVDESQQEVLADSQQKVEHESQQEVLADSQLTVVDESQQEVLADSQLKVDHESQPKVVDDSQQKVEHESQQIVLDDSQLTVVDESQQIVVDDSQLTVLDESQQIVGGDSQLTVVFESQQKVVDDSQLTVVSETRQKVVDDSQLTVVDETQQKVVDDSQLTVVDEAQQKAVDSQQTVVSETRQQVVNDSQQTLVSETRQKAFDDSQQTVVYESQQKVNQNVKALSHSTENEGAIAESTAEIEIMKTESYNVSPQTVTESREIADRTASIEFSHRTSTVYGHILTKTEATDGTCVLTLALHEDVQQQITAHSPAQGNREITQEGSAGVTYVSEQEEGIAHLRNSSCLDSGTPDNLVELIGKQGTVDIHDDVIHLEDCEVGEDRTNILEYKVVDNTLSLNSESIIDQELCNEETSSSHDALLDNVDTVLLEKNSVALDTCDSDSYSDIKDNVLSNGAPDTAATGVVVESTVRETLHASENIPSMSSSNASVLVEDGSVTVVIEEITLRQDHHFNDGIPTMSAANASAKVDSENFGKPQACIIDTKNIENTGCWETPQVVLHDGSSKLIVDNVKNSDPDLDQRPETTGRPGNSLPSSCSDDASHDVNTNTAYKSPTGSTIHNILEQQLIYTSDDYILEVGNNRTTASVSGHIESTDGYSSKASFIESTAEPNDVVKSDEKKFSSVTEDILNLADKQEVVYTPSLHEKTVLVIPTDTEEFTTTKELFTTTNTEILATPIKETFTTADKEIFPTTVKEIDHRTEKEISPTTSSKILPTTDNGVSTATSKKIFTTKNQELFAAKDKDTFTTEETFNTPGKETFSITDKGTLRTPGKDCITVTPEELRSDISKEHISIDFLEPSPATSRNSAPEIIHQLSQPTTVEQVTTPASSLSTSGLNIEASSTLFPSSLSSACLVAETSLPAEHFLAPESEQETVISRESGVDFADDVSSPATSVSQLQTRDTLDSKDQTLEATMHPKDRLEKLQTQLSLFSGDTGLNINVDRNPQQEAPDNFQNIVRASACNFTDFSKDQCESIGDESFLDHTNNGVSLVDELEDNSTKISTDNAAGSRAVGGYIDSDYDNVTTSNEPVEPQLFTRPHHLHLLQFANTKTSNLWALQEETESAMNTPSPKQSRATFVTEEDSSNLHSRDSVQIVQNNSTEQDAHDDQIRQLLNGQKQLVSDSLIVKAKRENVSALNSAGSDSGQFKSESEDTTQSAVTAVSMGNDASILAADESDSPSNIVHRQTPEITSGVFRAQLVNISSPDEEDSGVNSNVDGEKNRVSYLGTFTSNLGLLTNRTPGEITLGSLSSLDALSASLKQFDRTDIDTGDTKPLHLRSDSPSAPDSGHYDISSGHFDISSVRTLEIERNSNEEVSKASSYLPTHTIDLSDVSPNITQPPTETNSESVYTCKGTAEVKKTSLNDSPVLLTPHTNFTPDFTKNVMNHKLTNAKIKQFEKILYEFNKGLRTSQDISDFLFFCENYADYTNSSSSPEELYKYFTNDDSEKVQNHTCITLEDEDMNTFRFKRYLKKSHAKRNNGRKILRFLSRLSCVSESQSSFQNSPFDISSGKVKNADRDAHLFSMDSMTTSKMKISNPVLISSTSFQLHNILNTSPVKHDNNGNTGFDSLRTSADSAYSSFSDPTIGSLSSPAFRHTPGPTESVSSVFSLDITTGDWTIPDNVFSNTSDTTTRTSFAKTVRNQSGGQDQDTMFSLSDEFHHFNFSENEIDAALLNKMRYGHVQAKLN